MSKTKTTLRMIGTTCATLTIVASGLFAASSAGAVTKAPTPQVINECGVIEGNYMCGTPQWMQAALNAANKVNSEVIAFKQPIQSNNCSTITAVTSALGVLLYFMPAGEIVAYLNATIQGVTLAELQECFL